MPDPVAPSAMDRSAPRGGLWWCLTAGLFCGYVLLVAGAAERRDSDWSHLWLGGRMVVTGAGAELYDPQRQVQAYRAADPLGAAPAVWKPRNERLGCFNYPPPAALAYAGMAWLSLPDGAVVQALLTLLAAGVTAGAVARLSDRPHVTARLTAAVLLFPPFFANLALGQNGMMTLMVAVLACAALRNGRERSAGLLLALLALKPQWFLALVWVPAGLRRWRCLVWCGLGVLGICAATAAVVGVDPFLDYALISGSVRRLHDLPGYHLGLKYGVFGLARRCAGGAAWATPVALIAAVLIAGITLVHLWRRPWRPVDLGTIGVAVAAAGVVNPHLNHYDLVWMVVPLLLACAEAPRCGGRMQVRIAVLVVLTWAAWPLDGLLSSAGIVALPAVVQIAWWAHFMDRVRDVPSGPAREVVAEIAT